MSKLYFAGLITLTVIWFSIVIFDAVTGHYVWAASLVIFELLLYFFMDLYLRVRRLEMKLCDWSNGSVDMAKVMVEHAILMKSLHFRLEELEKAKK